MFVNIHVVNVRVSKVPPAPLLCSTCGTPETTDRILRSCKQCHTTQYCNTACQRKHWSEGGHHKKCQRQHWGEGGHKRECKKECKKQHKAKAKTKSGAESQERYKFKK